MRAQPGKALRQLAANRAAAQHHHALGQVAQFGKLLPQGVAGQVTRVIDARQRRNQGLRAGGNHDGAGCQRLLAAVCQRNVHRPGRGDFGVALQHLNAQRGVALNAVVRFDGADHIPHALHDGGEAERGLAVVQPIPGPVPDLVRHLGRLDQRLAGHAAVVQAIAAHFVRFHQRDFGLDRRRNVGRHQACGTRANHDQVAVKGFGLQMGPARVHLAALEIVHNFARQQRENAQKHQRAQQRWAQDALERVKLAQLGARIHIHSGARQHAELADPVKSPGAQLGQAHHQVDDEEGHQRHQAQREQVKRAVFGDAAVDLGQPLAKARLDAVAQHKARRQKRQGGPDAGGKRHQQGAPAQPKNSPACQREDGASAGQRQTGCGHVEQQESGGHLPRIFGVVVGKLRLALLEVGQIQKAPQVQHKERHDARENQRQHGYFFEVHAGAS